jgi:triosephosphate isomerase
MRVPLIAGNWKMNTTVTGAVALAGELRPLIDAITGVEKVVCPPFVSLALVKDVIAGSSVKLGAQDVYFVEKGAYTGEVSPPMLAGLCEYVIIGHSERRQYFNENEETVDKKVRAALKAGLKQSYVREKLVINANVVRRAGVHERLRDALVDVLSVVALAGRKEDDRLVHARG